MSEKVEINKHGMPVGWHGQSWVYYKRMMMIVMGEKGVLDYAKGTKTVADAKDQSEFNAIQLKIMKTIMASLSMELGQQVMAKRTGTEMWKYLEDTYEGRTNAATRMNQEIILFNRLQMAKCKLDENVEQHVDKLFTIKAQLAALNAEVRDPIFIQMLVQSLPKNERFDRLKGMMETGSKKMNSPDKVKDQILRMESYNKKDRLVTRDQVQDVGDKQKEAQAARVTDWKQGACFNCHQPGHHANECPAKDMEAVDEDKERLVENALQLQQK